MWNKIPSSDVYEECERREAQLLASPAHWGDLYAGGCHALHFEGTRASGIKILEQLCVFMAPSSDTPPLAVEPGIVRELRDGTPIEKTRAGGVILQERRRRERRREEELNEIREEEEERLRAERAHRERMAQQAGHRTDQGYSAGYEAEDHMAYGPNIGICDRSAGRSPGHARQAQTARNSPAPRKAEGNRGHLGGLLGFFGQRPPREVLEQVRMPGRGSGGH